MTCRWTVVLAGRERECRITGPHEVCEFRVDGKTHRYRFVGPERDGPGTTASPAHDP